ncbi:hypothetical protein J4448_01360 [Candidatus Woesearchaeota archaeon]|nr:hypothetical protein [Candidatus Woesearchaeota archaeon]
MVHDEGKLLFLPNPRNLFELKAEDIGALVSAINVIFRIGDKVDVYTGYTENPYNEKPRHWEKEDFPIYYRGLQASQIVEPISLDIMLADVQGIVHRKTIQLTLKPKFGFLPDGVCISQGMVDYNPYSRREELVIKKA